MFVAVPVVATSVFLFEKRSEVSPVAHGEELVVASGCYACHGAGEMDTRTNFRASSSGKYRAKSVPTFWENGIEEAAILKEWIRDGSTERERERHKRYLMQMPAYGAEHLDELQIDAMAAWVLAEGLGLSNGIGNGELPMPELTLEEVVALSEDRLFKLGDRLSRQQACYQCHGELGQGGVMNLASFKGYIPGFFGDGFLKLTDGGSREEIMHWIDHGRGIAIESGVTGVLSKKYFEGQAIPMPAYESLLSVSEKAILVDYLLLLNEKGPMASEDVEVAIAVLSQPVAVEQ